MTIDEVEALIKTKTRNKVRIHRLEERVGDSVAFLSYSIDDSAPRDRRYGRKRREDRILADGHAARSCSRRSATAMAA